VTSPLKDRDALIAKVTEYRAVKPWLTPGQAVAGVCDAIRYSWVIPAGEYTAGVHELIQKLRDQDFRLERLANFWGGPDFRGITSVWRSAGDLAHWFSAVSEDHAAVITEQVRRTAENWPT
jgi:hypothetical protein